MTQTTPIMAGIASIPERTAELEQTIASLAPQVDEIRLSLNGYTEEPLFLRRFPNVVATIRDHDQGDAEKFAGVDDWNGIVITCDDDLLYPTDYVARLAQGLDRHGHDRIVGFHGGTTDGWREQRHGAANVKAIACLGELRRDDADVNVLGTGAMAYDACHTPVWRSIFRSPNMADVYLACHAHRFGIPMVALAHESGWLGNLEPAGGATIYESNRAGDGSIRDTRATRKAELERIDWTATPHRPHVRVSVSTCERPELLGELLVDLDREARWADLEVTVYEDPSGVDYTLARAFVAQRGWTWITMPTRCGRRNYWMLVNRQLRDARDSDADWFLFLPDDVRLVPYAIPRAIDTWSRLDRPATLTLWRLQSLEGVTNWTNKHAVQHDEATEIFHVDGLYLCQRPTLETLGFRCHDPRPSTTTGSGVGRIISQSLDTRGRRMYRVDDSLAISNDGGVSVMNPEVRLQHPAVTL